ncbi:rRNA maturation RNase YbeY [Patescibacteria group bacterium]|nr:rRNA maturation RNase YbeY [Patescibacteria group bacterium]
MSEPTFSIQSTVRSYPKAAYELIKRDILGTRYTLSLTFVGPTRARSYNEVHRGKTYVPNVLSYPLDGSTGEIIICPSVAKREAKKFALSYTGYTTYLFIHGLLHLKGYDHGATMERMEERYKRKYSVA